MRNIDCIQTLAELDLVLRAIPRSAPTGLGEMIDRIIEGVRNEGEPFILRECQRFAPKLNTIVVGKSDLENAAISEPLAQAIQAAAKNIRAFHELLKPGRVKFSPVEGVSCERIPLGISRVGLYVPGGDTPLISSLLMQAIPAQIARCGELVLCTGANKDGVIDPALLWTANLLGITEVYAISGATAIATMAFGTPTIRPVYKITGPGSEFVNQAKLAVQRDGVCAIDLPAGPSELVVVIDGTVRSDFIAADIISQAEHSPDTFTAVISTDRGALERVRSELELQVSSRQRRAILGSSLESTLFIEVRSTEVSIQIVNALAPEHVILSGASVESLVPSLTSAGTVFVGEYTPESLGDYLSGMNHILPTKGGARAYSGCSVETYTKWMGVQRSSLEGLRALSEPIKNLALAEGLDGHAYAVAVRLS